MDITGDYTVTSADQDVNPDVTDVITNNNDVSHHVSKHVSSVSSAKTRLPISELAEMNNVSHNLPTTEDYSDGNHITSGPGNTTSGSANNDLWGYYIQLENTKLNNFSSTEDYITQVLTLAHSANIQSDTVISYLVRGLPLSMRADVIMQNFVTVDECIRTIYLAELAANMRAAHNQLQHSTDYCELSVHTTSYSQCTRSSVSNQQYTRRSVSRRRISWTKLQRRVATCKRI